MTRPSPDADLAEDLALIEAAALAAGALLAEGFGRKVASWFKEGDSPVSEIDLAADALLKDRLLSARPDYGWLSEETADAPERLGRRRVFIVDPLDGTRAFLKGRKDFCTSIAVVEDGRPIAAAVFAPAHGELFLAAIGAGARLNGAAIAASDRAELAGARLIGAPEFYSDRRWPVPWPPVAASPRNALAYRLCLAACGAFDGFASLGFKHEWDLAAGALIAAEAGAVVSDAHGGPMRFNQPEPLIAGVAAAGRLLHPLILNHTQPTPHASAFSPARATKPSRSAPMAEPAAQKKQLLHLVIGGELKDIGGAEFADLDKVEFVGAYPDFASAHLAWRGAAQRTVDNARMRFFILHAHRLLDPETGITHTDDHGAGDL